MPIYSKDHLAQTNHIKQEKIRLDNNDKLTTIRGKLASIPKFLVCVVYGFWEMLCFLFNKLFALINRKPQTLPSEQNIETQNPDSSARSDTSDTSSSSVQPHEKSIQITTSSEQNALSFCAERHNDITEDYTSDESLEYEAPESNLHINEQGPSSQESQLLINSQNNNSFYDVSENDILQFSITKLLMQDILAKDQLQHDETFDTYTYSAWEKAKTTPSVLKTFLSQYTPNPVNISSDPKCGVPLDLLHDIQRIAEMPLPFSEDIGKVKKGIAQTAEIMLRDLQSSPDFASIRQAKDTTTPHPLDAIRPFIQNESSLEDINFGKQTCKWEKPRNTRNTSKEDSVPQHVYDIHFLSEISSLLTTLSLAIGCINKSVFPARIHIPNYRSGLFVNKRACSEALVCIADSVFSYASEFSQAITRTLSSFMVYIEQEHITGELEAMITGDRSFVNPDRPTVPKLHEGYTQLKSLKAQRSLSQYPDSMCLLISHMLSGFSQATLKQDMNKIFQTMLKAKHDIEQPTDEQRAEIINDITLAFRRCTQEMKGLLVVLHQEQALKDEVHQDQIQAFLDTEDLVPELLEPPIHLIQHNK